MSVSLPDSLSGDGPLVSVIVPTYGDAEYVDGALESIAAQTRGNLEVVLVDGSGIDRLAALAEAVEWLTYVYQEPRGLAAARNRGIEAATGEVIAFLDADDRWVPTKLERQLPCLDAGADIVYADAYLVEGDRVRVQTSLPIRDPERHYIDFLYEGGVPMPTVVARARCFADERFDEDLPAAEDRNMWARLFERYRPGRVPEPLAYYTVREDSMSTEVETMYESELHNIAALVERFEALEPHREALERKAAYKHGKRLLRAGRAREARSVLRSVIVDGQRDVRTLALFALALSPGGHRRSLRWLESLLERGRRLGHRLHHDLP